MKRLFFLLLLIISLSGNCQVFDSISNQLQEKIRATSSDSLKIAYQYQLAKRVTKKDKESGEKLFEEALAIIENQKETTPYFLIFKARIYSRLAYIEENKSNYPKALEYHLASLKLCEEQQDSTRIANVFSNLGKLNSKLKQYKKAREFHKKGLKIRERFKLIKPQTRTLRYIAYNFFYEQQYDSSLVYLNRAKKLSTFPNETAKINVDIANIHYKTTKDYKKAIEKFEENIQLFTQLKNDVSKSITYQNLAKIYSDYGNQEKALVNINKALDLTLKIERKNTLDDLYKIKSLIYERMDNQTEALRNFKLYKSFSDSINSVEKTKKIKQIEQNHLLEKEKQKIEFETKNQQAKTKLYATLFISSLLFSFLLFLFFYYRRKINLEKIKKAQLEKQLLDEKLQLSTYKTQRVIADNKMRLQFKEELVDKLKTIKSSIDSSNTSFQSLINDLQLQIATESKLGNLETLIEEYDELFHQKLMNRFPTLTKGEREICSLIRLNLSLKEIMIVRNTSLDSIKSSRYRIRKKLGIPKEVDIKTFIQKLLLN